MGREGNADRTWEREAFRHARFAAGPARRAKETGIVILSLSTAIVEPQWACRVESEVVALEGSFPHIDDASRLDPPLLAVRALAWPPLARTFCEDGTCYPPKTPNLESNAATMSKPSAQELMRRKVLMRLGICKKNYPNSTCRRFKSAPRLS